MWIKSCLKPAFCLLKVVVWKTKQRHHYRIRPFDLDGWFHFQSFNVSNLSLSFQLSGSFILDCLTGMSGGVMPGFPSTSRQRLFPLRRAWGPQIFKSSTAAPLRSSWLAASPPGMATAPPSITWHYRGWFGQPSTSLGLSSLPSRTSLSGEKIVKDFSHPSHGLFSVLLHDKQS